MRELLRYLKGYTKESIIGPLFKMLEACFELFVPLVMANVIDVGIKNQDKLYIWQRGILLAGLGLLGLVCSLIAQYFAAKAAMGFGTALRKDLYSHINQLSYTELDALGTPALVTRMTSDINQAQAGVNLVLRLFLRSPFLAVGAVIMALSINPPITVIFLIAAPVISLVIFYIMKAAMPIYKKAQNMLDQVAMLTRENHIGVRVVRAFSRQTRETERFESISGELMDKQVLAGKIAALMNPITYVIVNLAIIVILWSGGTQVYQGRLSQGELAALISYMTQILLALLALSILVTAFTKAAASAVRINEVFHKLPSMQEHKEPLQESVSCGIQVEFKHVCFSYAKPAEDALENISFQAKKGQTIGIIGGTGAGKTTLINLIPRFYDVQEGQVLVKGIPVEEYPFLQLREKIGIVPQKAVLFRGTIRENMKWGKSDASDQEIYEALSIAQAKEIVDKNSEGLDMRISQGGRNLSGGQRQRLTIARALVSKPEILILDDSSAALDYATDAKLRKALKEKTKGMTVFLVSQRAASIRSADQILVLDDGKLAGIGTHQELLDTCQVYQEICKSQFSQEEAAQ